MPNKRYLKEILIKIYFRILRTFFALNNVENFEQTIFFLLLKEARLGLIFIYICCRCLKNQILKKKLKRNSN
jgi:hypothetical protein